MNKYNEIIVLKKMLEDAKIPFDFSELYGGFHIEYPNTSDRVCSVIENDGSYGRNIDKLEIMGLLTSKEAETDSVSGNLTAKNVFKRIKGHFDEARGNIND